MALVERKRERAVLKVRKRDRCEKLGKTNKQTTKPTYRTPSIRVSKEHHPPLTEASLSTHSSTHFTHNPTPG